MYHNWGCRSIYQPFCLIPLKPCNNFTLQGVILYIIIEDIHQFIGHCLILLDIWFYIYYLWLFLKETRMTTSISSKEQKINGWTNRQNEL